MMHRVTKAVAALCLTAVAVGCADSPATPDPTPTPAPAPVAPVITVGAPTPVSPAEGAAFFGWPTLTVRNAERTNTPNALVYRFDISDRQDFATVAVSSVVTETTGQTSYTPPATQAAPAEGPLYWRVTAIDQSNAVLSTPTAAQSFTYFVDTVQNRVATQLYGGLWPGLRPTGTTGKARQGPGWTAGLIQSFNGVTFQSPPLEVLRIYDLLDRGYQPQAAIDWMSGNGYPNLAAWYPGPVVIGFTYQYMALINGEWELVRRVGY